MLKRNSFEPSNINIKRQDRKNSAYRFLSSKGMSKGNIKVVRYPF